MVHAKASSEISFGNPGQVLRLFFLLLAIFSQSGCGTDEVDLSQSYSKAIRCADKSVCQSKNMQLKLGKAPLKIVTIQEATTTVTHESYDTTFNLDSKPYWVKTAYDLFAMEPTIQTIKYEIRLGGLECENIPRSITLYSAGRAVSLYHLEQCG
jgi:hypothetical protein